MTDNLDKLLYAMGGEANSQVDFEGMYESLLAADNKKRSVRIKTVRYIGTAAACVMLLGMASLLPGGMKLAKPQTEADAAPAEAAPVMEEAAPAEAPEFARGAEDVVTADGAALETALDNACDTSCAETIAEEETEECIVEEAPAAEAQAESGAVLAPELFEIGSPREDFAEFLEESFGMTFTPSDRTDIEEGYAEITCAGNQAAALWNIGGQVWYIEIKDAGSAKNAADMLRTACN